MKVTITSFVISLVVGVFASGMIRIALLPSQIIQASLDGFTAAKEVDEIKVIAPHQPIRSQ